MVKVREGQKQDVTKLAGTPAGLKAKAAAAVSWAGIPAAERAGVRRVMSQFADNLVTKVASDPQEAWKQIQAGREAQANAELARAELEKAEEEKRREQNMEWARKEAADVVRLLAHLRDELDAIGKGHRESPEDAAILSHALLERCGRRLEQALCDLEVIPEVSGRLGGGSAWFQDNDRLICATKPRKPRK